MPYLELHDVSVSFPIRTLWGTVKGSVDAVKNINLNIEQGQILGLVGESGCGKSTLSRAIMQLHPVNSGRIILDGEELTTLSKSELRKRRLNFQMIFQDPYASLNPRFSVFSTLSEALSQRKTLSQEEKNKAVIQLMQRVGLNPDLMHKYPHEFSGGQRQRIAIARAIAPEPKLIIADEPVSALDVSIQSQILNLLTSLSQDLGLTMIFISHDLSVVRYMSQNIVVMQHGSIVEAGDAEQVFNNPQSPYTQQLLSAIPKI